MYRDKTRRKRHGDVREPSDRPMAATLSDMDLKKAATGVL